MTDDNTTQKKPRTPNMGRLVHGFASKRHPLHSMYNRWCHMINRCTNPKYNFYYNYGGRGIGVCRRWSESFAIFVCDMGSPPTSRHQIDRINNDGNYEPGNCRWATQKEQLRNRRGNVILALGEKTQCLAQWAEECGIHAKTISGRIASGWSVAKSLTTPTNAKFRSKSKHST